MRASWYPYGCQTTIILTLLYLPSFLAKSSGIEEITSKKDFEKLLRTRNNVLTLFKKTPKDAPSALLKTLDTVANQLKGSSMIIQVDCSSAEGRKICNREKANPADYVIKHYLKGQYNKNYDRPEAVKSFVTFLNDPTSESPWEEDPTAKDVVHVEDSMHLRKFLQDEKKPILLMFYAPWCGHCKALKPDYSAAATELKRESVLAAMDLAKPKNSDIKQTFNISGFPTLFYFRDGAYRFPFGGGRSKDEIVAWMRNPVAPRPNQDEGPKDTKEDAKKEEL